MRSTHAYQLYGIGTPRESLLQVRMDIDGHERHMSIQAACELAEDLLVAAGAADKRGCDVRASLISRW